MNAWSKCEQSNNDKSFSPSEKVQEILDNLCEQYKAEGRGIAPNEVSFSICLQSWFKSTQPYAAERAEEILRRKEEFSRGTSDGVLRMKVQDYNSVISKWKNDPILGPDHARRLFDEMMQKYNESHDETIAPTIVTFNTLLDVYAKSANGNSAEKAESLLKQMKHMHREGKSIILPDMISYRICMDAWIRQRQDDSPQKVDELVNYMMDKYKREGRKDLIPDANSFNLILKACAQSRGSWADDQQIQFPYRGPTSTTNPNHVDH